MAIYHLHASVVHRSLGHSAVAAAAYAAGKDLYNARAEKMETYGRKHGVFHTDILAPENAPQWVYDRQHLWNLAEQVEKRIDAQTARIFVLALPHELEDEQKIALVDQYVREVLVSQGMVVDIGMHRADRHGDQRNDHVHLVMTMRELDGDSFSSRKNREWNRTETLLHWREQWASYQNRALEEAGWEARVDHRTLEEQGIDREPTTHVGRKATLMERRGEQSELGDQNRKIQAHNAEIEALVSELAAIDAEITRETEAELLAQERLANDAEPSAEEGIFHVGAISNPLNLPASVLDEISRIRAVFHEGAGVEESKQETPAPLPAQEEEPAPFDLFSSPLVKAFEADIRERGAITEWGLRNSFLAQTVTMFENFYYGTIDAIKAAFERLVGGNEEVEGPEIEDPEINDYEPDR